MLTFAARAAGFSSTVLLRPGILTDNNPFFLTLLTPMRLEQLTY